MFKQVYRPLQIPALLSIHIDYLICWWVMAMIVGICFCFTLPSVPSWGILIAVAGAMGVTFFCAHRFVQYQFMLRIVGFFLLGFVCMIIRVQTHHPVLLQRDIAFLPITAQILSKDIRYDGVFQYRIKIIKADTKKPIDIPKIIRLTSRHPEPEGLGRPMDKGDVIALNVGLTAPAAPLHPNGFNFRQHAWFAGFGAYGYSLSQPKIITAKAHQDGFTAYRQYLRSTLDKVGKDSPHRGVTYALMTEQRAAIPAPILDDLRNSGLSHMLSVSGLHVELLAGIIFFSVRFLLIFIPLFLIRPLKNARVAMPAKKIAAFISLLIVILYVYFVGAPIAAVRSAVMCGLALVAIMLNRWPFTARLMSLCALGALLIRPEWALDVSFQMSFAAVACLLVFFDQTRSFWQVADKNIIQKIGLYFLGILASSILATFATSVFGLYHFNTLSLSGLLANMIGAPVFAFWIMPALILSYGLALIHMADIPLWVSLQGVTFLDQTAAFFAAKDTIWESLHFSVPVFPIFSLCLILLGIAILLFTQGWGRWGGFIPIIIATLFIHATPAPSVLITDNGDLYAIQSDQNLFYSTAKKERYARKEWAKWLAIKEENQKPLMDFKDIQCDPLACRVQIKEKSISIITYPTVLETECQTANLIIMPHYATKQPCKAPIIDARTLHTGGAHAVYMHKGSIEIKQSEKAGYNWPWDQR